MNATERAVLKAGVTIRELTNVTKGETFGTSFMADLPKKLTATKRLRKQFDNRTDALNWAAAQVAGGRAAGLEFFGLTDGERRDAVGAIKRIRGTGLTLAQCLDFALPHLLLGQTKTVSEVVAELLAHREARGKSARYLGDLRSRLGKFGEAFPGAVDSVTNEAFPGAVASVTGVHLQHWLDSLKLKPQTVKNFRTVLHTLFRFAERRGYIAKGTNPAADTERIAAGNGDAVEIYSAAEITKLLAAAPANFKPCLALAAFAGLRSAEIERLDWADIDLKGGLVTVAADKSKTASRRLVPILPNLKAWLAPYATPTGPVWGGTHDAFYDAQQATAEAAGVAWKPNALRHSFISYRLAVTQNAAQTSMEAGNSAQVVFKHYRELVKPKDAKRWFNVKPAAPANVLTLSEKRVANG